MLDEAGLEDAHLLGVSMGAAAVLQFALRNPARARDYHSCIVGGAAHQPQGEKKTIEAPADFAQSAGGKALAERMLELPSRHRLKDKNPAEYRKFIDGSPCRRPAYTTTQSGAGNGGCASDLSATRLAPRR